MKLFRKNKLALLLPLLVVGCAGKGGFDPLIVDNDEATLTPSQSSKKAESNKSAEPSKKNELVKPAKQNESVKPTKQNEPVKSTELVKSIETGAHTDMNTENTSELPKQKDQLENQEDKVVELRHTLGWMLDITRRNKARFKEDGSMYADVKRERTDGEIINFPGQAEGSLPIDPQQMKSNQKLFEPSAGFDYVNVGFEDYSTSPKNDIYEGKHKVYVGHVGTLRYQADNTAKALPESDQEFTYKGLWSYMTDIDVLREELAPPSEVGETVTWTSNGRTAGVDYSGSSEFDDVVRERSEFSEIEKDKNGKIKYRDRGHFAEFKVHFGEKRLTGKLSRTPRLSQETHDAYTIDASINKNRFSGKATVNPLDDERNDNNLYFKTGSQNVEGGFYGDTAQELAGSFLADDNSIAVAFGAKRQENLDANTPLTHLVDGERINVDHNEDFTHFSLNNLSGHKYLFVDGHNIPLAKNDFISAKSIKTDDGEIQVNYCCNQFEYLTLGEIKHTSTRHKDITNYDNEYDDEYYENEVPYFEEETNKYAEGRYFKDKYYIENEYQDGKKLKYTPFNRSLFLQGERSKETPKDGTVKYQGSWQANIVHQNIPHSVTPNGFDEGTRAAFEANFDEKKLTGQLWRKGDVSNAPSVLIDADIKGVAFEGSARTGEYGINVDPDRTLNNQSLHFKVPTKGLFYGEKAAELGGSFSFTGISYKDKDDNRVYDKVGAVYGAKQVEQK